MTEEDGILENEGELLKTTRNEGTAIVQFLVSYHAIKEEEIDFRE